MRAHRTAATIALAALFSAVPPSALAQSAIIDGLVTGPNGQPVDNAHVTLTDDSYSPLSSKYTDASGRFRFSVTASTYYVEIEAPGKPYKPKRERVEVNPSPFGRGGEIFRVDVTLAADRPANDAGSRATGVRFVQQIPEGARKEYERGVQLIREKPDEGAEALRQAITLFPDYYDARELLGTELVKSGKYADALPLLTRAVEINPSGELSFYALGVLNYRSSKYAEAVAPLKSASALNPKSANIALYLGLALWRSGDAKSGEEYLKRAYENGAKAVPDLHLALTSIYIQAKRKREAAAQLRLLLKEVPNLKDRDKIKALIDKLEKDAA